MFIFYLGKIQGFVILIKYLISGKIQELMEKIKVTCQECMMVVISSDNVRERQQSCMKKKNKLINQTSMSKKKKW